ncbi:reverse transcriptase domain-containing protein, partial [Tanacetum coccineum]
STTLERKKDPNDFNLSAPNSHHEDEELSSDKDVDEWLNAEMSKRMTRQDKEEEEDALIDILKIVLPPKEMNPGSFTLSCTIGNLKLYVMTDLGAGVNVMPKSLFEHFQLADLKETSMVVEMADMTKKAPLGIMENILVKIDKFMFHFDFVVIDMLKGLNETMILGRPFLATIHAQIDVFRREILLGIGEEKVNFDMNGGICHSRELEGSQDDEVGSHLLENVVSRWHVCKPVRITFVDCEKDCGQWPTCNPDLRFCSGYDAIYGQEKVRCSIRYGNKNINDVTRERRYYEWVAHNYDFNVKSRRATEKERYALDEVWEKCEKFHDTIKLWYDKGFEEEELWQNGIEEIDYTPLILVQKAKLEWLQLGDSNTAYFYKVVKSQAARNRIDSVTTSNGVCVDGDQEIRDAIFAIGDNKAPGPNGYSTAFFKEVWDIIDADVSRAINEFFTNRVLLKELNHTIIALILKLMHNYHLDRGTPRCAFKVDIQKTYDTVDWNFLREVLIGFGFHPRMIGRIMECVTSTSFSVGINGSLYGYFKVIMDSLEEFKNALGLTPNLPKSTAYFCNVLNYVKISILNILPFKEAKLPVKYLGVPQVPSRLLYRDCSDLIEKVKRRISDWKNKSLSFAGRFSSFALFLREMKKGKAKVSWEVVCLPKKEGGLVNGARASAWFDNWCSLSPLLDYILNRDIYGDMFRLSAKVMDVIDSGAWRWPIEWNSKYPNLDYIILLNLSSISVRLVWKNSDNILRHAIHLWLVIHRKHKTQDKLRQWDVSSNTNLNLLRCLLCKTQPDSHDHSSLQDKGDTAGAVVVTRWRWMRGGWCGGEDGDVAVVVMVAGAWYTKDQENLNPRPKDYPFMDWLLTKVGHTNVSKPVKKSLLKIGLIDCFQEDVVKDLRESSFDDYKWMFDLEIDQLVNEYELGIGNKGHMLEDIWENCRKVQGDNTYWWHDKKSEEEERRKLGVE